MRLSYHSDTDSLYIHFSEKPGADVVEVSKDFVVDVDADGVPVGIDVSFNASRVVDLSRLELDGVPLDSLHLASEPRNQQAVG